MTIQSLRCGQHEHSENLSVALQATRIGSDPLEAWAAIAMAEVHGKCGRLEDGDAALQLAKDLLRGAKQE